MKLFGGTYDFFSRYLKTKLSTGSLRSANTKTGGGITERGEVNAFIVTPAE